MTLALPGIWQSGDKELDETVRFFFANGNLSSSPENWGENGRIRVLFNILRNYRSPETLLSVLDEGLVPGALKLPRHIQTQAHQLVSTIRIDIICDQDDDSERQNLWNSKFISILHDFFLEMDDKKINDTGMDNALGLALANICLKRPEDFELIWEREIKSFEWIINVGPRMGTGDISFNQRGTRWLMLTSSILRHLFADTKHHARMTSIAISAFITSLARIFTFVCDVKGTDTGEWIEGMEFVHMFLSSEYLLDCFSNSLEMEGARQSLENLLLPVRMKSLLRSPASVLFIRVILRYSYAFSKEDASVWQMLLKEAIPEEGSIDVRNSESLIYKLVSETKNAKRSDFKAPEGVHTNLVQELTQALKAEDLESLEETNLLNLFVDLVVLRRILISDETALAMVQNLGLDYEDLHPLMTQIAMKDPAFAEVLLASRPIESPSQSSDTWSVMGLLMEVCEVQFKRTPIRLAFERALTNHQELDRLCSDCVTFAKDKILRSSIRYILSLQIINNSPEVIAEFVLWFYELLKGDERLRMIRKLFDFPYTDPTGYPHPSLALTSVLDNIFLPFLPHDSEDGYNSDKELQPTLRLCVFYAIVLDREGTDMLFVLEKGSGKEFTSQLLIFLLLHSQYMKNMVALPPVQGKVDEGEMDEGAFQTFQEWLSDLLKEVSPFIAM